MRILQHAGVLQQAADGVSGLSAVLDPCLSLLGIDGDGSGLGQRIVSANLLNAAAARDGSPRRSAPLLRL